MRKQTLLLAFALLGVLIGINTACSRKATVEIEAQIIYKMGGAQPVARTTFYVLNTDIEDLHNKLKPKNDDDMAKWYENLKEDERIGINALLKFLIKLNVARRGSSMSEEDISMFVLSKPIWSSYIVSSMQTDFQGKAKVDNIPTGDYWIVGTASTRAGMVFWNHKVSIKSGENKILLSQDNAEYSK